MTTQRKIQAISLVTLGAFIGAAVTLFQPAVAEKPKSAVQQALGQNPDMPYEDVRRLSDAFEIIKQNYVEEVDDKKIIEGALAGMASSLDPHSRFSDEQAMKDLNELSTGKFGGLGMEVGMEDGLVRVTAPIEDSPAWKAGIKSGDFILKIDNTSVRGLSLNEAVKKMRGEPKTKVTLSVLRKGQDEPLIFNLTRDIINVKSVKYKLTEPNYGYVRVTQFQGPSTALLVSAINDLYKQNNAPLKGLVLDLRNNPGGLINASIGISGAFLPANSLVTYTSGRMDGTKREYKSVAAEYFNPEERSKDALAGLNPAAKTVPLVVLINGGSASASEIVSGALQDYGRAVILGTKSFGKGSVQTTFPVGDGKTALTITIAKYFTPKGNSIQAKGITPDIEVEEGEVTKNSNSERFLDRESELQGHLANPSGEEDKPKITQNDKADAKEGKTKTEEKKFDPAVDVINPNDAQFKQAMTVLKVQQILQKSPAQ